ncbi:MULTISPECIES: DUF6612 family protein [Paenibacillus]|jgi:hypothetical protein|uniref:Lipoprotein n=1 Tax=Paenibacillus phytohabitans TaxID=2654978 RepID=A0ABX1YHX9_9BACL|nr:MULTISPECIES: DUF6612 family protein [Paenibacillus]AIQ26856.1 hypothetical protein P40081_00455 [Paenibacillus sp. FSL P4-0081]NOU79761.1 hypothetical protein [Paenibacillus phytohabitans]OMF20459.1 hypothetical protein BK132_34525 [Paenibacillus sp. FSL H8-0259]
MNKKWGLSAAALLLTAAVILPGCAKKEAPKEALSAAANKVAAMTSYEMKTKLTVNDLTIDTGTSEADATTGQILSMLKNAELTVDGVYQAEPMQTELTMVLNLKGDMAMSFTVPMVMTAEKLYVKVPSIPFLPLPETIVGKFVEVDLKELAEQEGAEFNPSAMDTQKVQKLSNEVMNTLLGEYDEEKYFNEIKPKEAGLPEGVEAKQVVQFQVTNDNVKEALTILVNNALPKIIDILGKDEYKELLKIDAADLAKAKEELQSSEARAEFDKDLAELNTHLTINQFHLNTAINDDNFPVYQDMLMDIKVNDPEQGENVALSMTASNQYSKINEKQTFQIGIPQGEDVITLEELQQQFGATGTY